MSLKEFQKVATNRYQLDITVDGNTFCEAIKEAYKKNGKKINVPGFRKGKAPLSFVEKYYGESVFFEDALDIIYPDAVNAAIIESGLKFVDDKIDFDLISIDKTNGVEFKVTITVEPEVAIKGYKGLKAEKVKAVVNDEEINAEINAMAERNSRMVTVEDRAAKIGDTAVIDFEGFVEEKAFEGGKGEAYSLELGSGSFIPGFEDQIAGHNTGDEFDVNVKFPEDYTAKELAGKDATFKVKLNEIKVKELPEVDDEFAKDVSEFDTLDALKADLKEKALERKTKQSQADLENSLMEQVIGLVEAEIPQAMIDHRAEQSVQEFAYRLQSQGLDLETYLKYLGGGSLEDFKKSFIPQAENQVKLRLGLAKIAEIEKCEVSEEELNAEYDKLAKMYDIEADKVKASIPASELTKDLVIEKAVELIKAAAVITEVDKKTEKKEPAKKTTTKKSTTKKADGEKAEEKKTTAKKATTKSTEAKSTTTKTSTAKKTTTTKKADGEKAPAKKTTTKKTTTKKDAE